MQSEINQYARAEALARKTFGDPPYSQYYIDHLKKQLQETEDSLRSLYRWYFFYHSRNEIPVLKLPHDWAETQKYKLTRRCEFLEEEIDQCEKLLYDHIGKIRTEANRIYQFWLSNPFTIHQDSDGKEYIQATLF